MNLIKQLKSKLKLIDNTEKEIHSLMQQAFPVGMIFKHGEDTYEVLDYCHNKNLAFYNQIHAYRNYETKSTNGIDTRQWCAEGHYPIEIAIKWRIE
jgi:hypothetical protein